MLPKNLLLLEFKNGYIKPKYLNSFDLIEQIITIFKTFIGKKYKELKKNLKELESGRADYKLVRGLAELIQRKCEFVPDTDLNSQKIRSMLFEKGFVINEEERTLILTTVAKDLAVSKNDIENAMFADLLKEQKLKQIKPLTPEELLRQYNLSTTQTLLFNATEIIFSVENNYQQIFRAINYLGLMYETDGKEIRVSGPASLLKQTKKYGSSLAKLLSFIVQSANWSIKAKIEIERNNEPRIFTFNLNSGDGVLFPLFEKKLIKFDSDVEEQFFKDFRLFAPDWEIRREPTFIKTENRVIIPDFGFYKNNIVVYLEIIGFWTSEYLKKKLQKLNNAETEIIAAINKSLKCSREDFSGDVINYSDRIPLKPILDILKRKEKEKIKIEIANNQKINFQEKIVDLNAKAKELNISSLALEQINIPNYFLVSKKFVSKEFLEDLKNEIGKKRKFAEIKPILDKYQLTDKALDLLGFKIVWNGLTPVKIVENE